MHFNEPQPQRLVGGRYEVLSVLGCGGSSIVYLARHLALQRDVAIKVMRPEVFDSPREFARYLREARIVASLNHPNIVTLFDVGELRDGRPYMVMEVVAGRSLAELLRDNIAVDLDLALALFEQVARALSHAHRHGIVHRDIKPGNILLRDRSTGYPMAKVADFGVASQISGPGTHSGDFIGTPMYMSPEQAQSKPVSAASDIYSLGIVMYCALTGRKPFAETKPMKLAMCHVTEPIGDVRAFTRHDIPGELADIVARCLEKDPADRYQDADALVEALMGVHLSMTGPLRLLSQETLDGGIRPASVRRSMGRRAGVLAIALTAVGLGIAVGWMARSPVWVEVGPPILVQP